MKSAAVSLARFLSDQPFVAAGARRALATARVSGGTLTVLTYHRVTEPSDRLPPGIFSASPEAFDRQMEMVAHDFNVVGPDELRAAQQGAGLPDRALVVTFDDADGDFPRCAWPALQRWGVPAIMFVPSGYPDTGASFWWDRLYRALLDATQRSVVVDGERVPLTTRDERLQAYRSTRVRVKALPHDEAMSLVDSIVDELGAPVGLPLAMSWDEIARLQSEGLHLGCHSHDHPMFDRITTDRLRSELTMCATMLADRLGAPTDLMAYPGGQLTDAVVDEVRAAGHTIAFTTDRGINRLDDIDWLRLRRVNVGANTSAGMIRAQAVAYGLRR